MSPRGKEIRIRIKHFIAMQGWVMVILLSCHWGWTMELVLENQTLSIGLELHGVFFLFLGFLFFVFFLTWKIEVRRSSNSNYLMVLSSTQPSNAEKQCVLRLRARVLIDWVALPLCHWAAMRHWARFLTSFCFIEW